jgi:hypothetical protein
VNEAAAIGFPAGRSAGPVSMPGSRLAHSPVPSHTGTIRSFSLDAISSSEFLQSSSSEILSDLATTYLGFCPRLDFTLARPHAQRFPASASFRPQVFTTSRRLTPHQSSRACFISQPSSGQFSRPGVPRVRAAVHSPRASRAPLSLSPTTLTQSPELPCPWTSTSRPCSARGCGSSGR